MIECQNISLFFDGKSVLNFFQLKVEKGQHVCLSGASGSGKSSVLKLIQGYLLARSGSISVDGLTLTHSNVQEIRNKIIWIPQNINLPVDTGVELLELLNLKDKKDRVEVLLTSLGLDTSYLQKNFGEISGGEKQRVIVALCLSMDREIILMDEPTSSLDEDSILLLIQTLKSLTGKCILSTSHNQTWLDNVDKVLKL